MTAVWYYSEPEPFLGEQLDITVLDTSSGSKIEGAVWVVTNEDIPPGLFQVKTRVDGEDPVAQKLVSNFNLIGAEINTRSTDTSTGGATNPTAELAAQPDGGVLKIDTVIQVAPETRVKPSAQKRKIHLNNVVNLGRGGRLERPKEVAEIFDLGKPTYQPPPNPESGDLHVIQIPGHVFEVSTSNLTGSAKEWRGTGERPVPAVVMPPAEDDCQGSIGVFSNNGHAIEFRASGVNDAGKKAATKVTVSWVSVSEEGRTIAKPSDPRVPYVGLALGDWPEKRELEIAVGVPPNCPVTVEIPESGWSGTEDDGLDHLMVNLYGIRDNDSTPNATTEGGGRRRAPTAPPRRAPVRTIR